LKTTYYLRSLGATAVEKSATETPQAMAEPEPKVCSILDPDCDACQ
jgi:ribonucleoside-diphosphate reductase alpha chain